MNGAPSRARRRAILAVFGVALVGWLVAASLFTVDVAEYGAVTRFGRIVRIIEAPGLGAKLPYDQVVRIDKRLLQTWPEEAEYLSLDKKNLVVKSLITWRVADPRRFIETVVSRARADTQLSDLVLAEIGTVLGRYPFASLISTQTEQSQFVAVIDAIRDAVNAVARPAYGIEVVAIRFRQLALPDQNKRYVFERMQAERGKIAMGYRSEGEREFKKIVAAANRERTRILAEAYREAAQTKGEGEAEVIRIYAERFGQNPQFYKFLRTLKAYEKILDGNTTIFLPADADAFRMLQNEPGAAPTLEARD